MERLGEEKRLSFCTLKGKLSFDPVKITSAQRSHFTIGESPISVSPSSELVVGSLCEEVVGSTAKLIGESDWELSHDALCLVNRTSCCEKELDWEQSGSLSESSLPLSSQFSISLSWVSVFTVNVDFTVLGMFNTEARISFMAVALSKYDPLLPPSPMTAGRGNSSVG